MPTLRAPARALPRTRSGSLRTAARLVALLLGLLTLLVPVASVAAAAERWSWPMPGAHVVSRPFGLGATPFAAGHRGADLPAPAGTPVSAAGAGLVSYAGLLAGRGVVVVVHGPLRTTYKPVTAVVRVGQAVAAGQQLGTLDAGHAGCPVAACLHWGLLRGAVYLDPVQLVDRGPVRLLPLDVPPIPAGLVPAGLVPAGLASAGTEPRTPVAIAGADRHPGETAGPDAGALTQPAAGGPSPGHRTAVAGTALALGAGVWRWWQRARVSRSP